MGKIKDYLIKIILYTIKLLYWKSVKTTFDYNNDSIFCNEITLYPTPC